MVEKISPRAGIELGVFSRALPICMYMHIVSVWPEMHSPIHYICPEQQSNGLLCTMLSWNRNNLTYILYKQ